tara:strand:+ start:2077 stop:2622 length:546 start_codon:yes stop_codon:yes gene_type:complete
MHQQKQEITYGLTAKIFHWSMAPLFIGMFIVAYIMMELSPSDTKWTLYGIHKSVGALLLILITARFLWRLVNQVPDLPNTVPAWQKVLAHANILLLYAVMLGMAGSGMTMSILGGHSVSIFGLIDIPAFYINKEMASLAHSAHGYISYVFIASFSLHVMGAFYHHFILKDNVLQRIWFNNS